MYFRDDNVQQWMISFMYIRYIFYEWFLDKAKWIYKKVNIEFVEYAIWVSMFE